MDILNILTGMQKDFGGFVQSYQLIITAVILPFIFFIPKLLIWIKNHLSNLLVINLIIDEAENMSGEGFINFNGWLTEHRIEWLSRTFEVMRINDFSGGRRSLRYALSAGAGLQVFKYQGRWFILKMTRREAKGQQNVLTGSFTMFTARWNRTLLEPLIKEAFKPVSKFRPVIIEAGCPNSPLPEYYGQQKQLISSQTYAELKNVFERFVGNEDLYMERQMPYKETILLYGPPGTGKTNVVRHFAQLYQMDICVLNPDTFSREELHFIRDIAYDHHGTIYLIEDIDSNPNFCRDAADKFSPDDLIQMENDFGRMISVKRGDRGSLSELLNGLDGIRPLHKQIVIMTTNYPERLYKSIYREGRVDSRIAIEYLPTDELIEYLGWEENDVRREALEIHPDNARIPAATITRLKYCSSFEDVTDLLTKSATAHTLSDYKGV